MTPDQPAGRGSTGRSRRGGRGRSAAAGNAGPMSDEPRVVARRAANKPPAEEPPADSSPADKPATPRRRRARAAPRSTPAEETKTTNGHGTARAHTAPESEAAAAPSEAAEEAAAVAPAPTRRRSRRGAAETAEPAANGGGDDQTLAAALRSVQAALEDLSRRVDQLGRRQRLGVFVDVPNVLYGGERSDQPISMGKLLDYLAEGRELVRATAYSPVSDDPREPVEEQRFVKPFVPFQYRIVTKPLKRFADGSIKGNFDVEMAIEMVTMAERLDVVALVSGDADFARAVEVVQGRGVKLEVVAFDNSASAELRALADEFISLDGLVDRLR